MTSSFQRSHRWHGGGHCSTQLSVFHGKDFGKYNRSVVSGQFSSCPRGSDGLEQKFLWPPHRSLCLLMFNVSPSSFIRRWRVRRGSSSTDYTDCTDYVFKKRSPHFVRFSPSPSNLRNLRHLWIPLSVIRRPSFFVCFVVPMASPGCVCH
jgi:hypothetical protein